MKRISNLLLLFVFAVLSSCSGQKFTEITILETTDLHGMLWPYDYVEMKEADASLASIQTYFKKMRSEKDAVVLLDNGDNIQGQPSVYYYNYIDTVSRHLMSRVLNFMDYDAGSVGNHDIEAGHSVYDKLAREYKFPLLAANAVEISSGEPYFKPYCIIEKEGIKIAVLGLITPAVPTWLPEELYRGMEFRDMTETAMKWMPVIKREKPDLIIGLFHSGWDRSREQLEGNKLNENGSASVAYNVPGFDIIFNGHDHRTANELLVNAAGDTVVILNGGSRAFNIAQADVVISSKKIHGKRQRKITGSVINVSGISPDQDYLSAFTSVHDTILRYVNRKLGSSLSSVSSRDSYFGSSAFVDLIHSMQLEITGADISFAAPLSFDVSIAEGDITVGDMFKLYRFENMLYTIKLTGEEVKKYLEFSYADWLNTMKDKDDLLLKLRVDKDGEVAMTDGKAWFRNQSYNFDSAVGIEYTVDVTRKEGERIKITGFTDGRKFEDSATYNIALNSYRGNGGGGHLTEGAGLSAQELKNRLVRSTDRDLRYYIMQVIESKKTIDPKPFNNWSIIPEDWVKSAKSREYSMLFGK